MIARRLTARVASLSVIVFMMTAALAPALPTAASTPVARPGARQDVWDLAELLREPSYAEVLAEYEQAGYRDVPGVDIRIEAARYAAAGGDGIRVGPAPEGMPGSALQWTGDGSWVEWEVAVPAAGLYEMEIAYYALPGKRASIQRDIQVNGIYPFFEAKRLAFTRQWQDEGPPKFDNRGDHMRPRQVEVSGWQTGPLRDAGGLYRQPFRFYLTEGVNRIRMGFIREPMAVAWLRVRSPVVTAAYREVQAQYGARGLREVPGHLLKVQTELPRLKSDPTIRGELDTDPIMEPPDKGSFILNSFGGWRWRVGGQWAEWEIEAPAEGLYQIAIKFGNWYQADFPSSRQLEINGRVPFAEMEEVQFRYCRCWVLEPLADEQGRPYLFHLNRGRNTVRLTNRVGGARDAIHAIEETTREMARLARQVILFTGPDPDPNVDWELHKQIPDLLPRLEAMADRMQQESEKLEAWSGGRPAASGAMRQVSEQLRRMVRYPRTIPQRLDDLTRSQQSLGTWALGLRDVPLILDYIAVQSPGETLPRANAAIPAKIWHMFLNIVRSFFKDYTGVGNRYDERDGPVLDVWVARGREWVQILKEMADEEFTPQTGIRVNMNVLPAGSFPLGVLILATVSGQAPDVALGFEPNVPVEFAIRGAAADLRQFPDYGEMAKRFRPGALIPFEYQGGAFALPEDQDFSMLFYRTDILGQLGLKPPQTWEDVYDMLPLLQQNGLEFYYRSPADQAPGGEGMFTPFLFQMGGSYYTPDGKLSALDTPEAFAAFKAWTGLWTNYRLPRLADWAGTSVFFNRMRTGEMPVGVANYQTYVLLSVAAPELTGWWAMAPMPGHRRPDGTIDRTIGGSGRTAMILKQSKKQQDAWEFIKWWTNAEVQIRYGTELEALIGVEARWNTANVEALRQLPWPKGDLDAILEQWEQFREVPVVLGGYFTGRHVRNAWNRVVLQGVHPREALEDAVRAIDRELAKKQEEFGFTPIRRTYGKGATSP